MEPTNCAAPAATRKSFSPMPPATVSESSASCAAASARPKAFAPREVLAQQRAHVRAPQPRACRCADKEASTTPPPRQRNEPPPRIVGRAGRADARRVARGVVEQRAEQQRRRGHDDARAQRADERDGARRAVARVGEAVEGEEGDGRGGEGGCAGRPGSPGGASYCIPRWAGCGPQVGDIHPCLLVETSSPQFVCSVKSKFFRGCDTSGSPWGVLLKSAQTPSDAAIIK